MIETFAQPAGQTVSQADVQSAAQPNATQGASAASAVPWYDNWPLPGYWTHLYSAAEASPGIGSMSARLATGIVGGLFILGGLGVLAFGDLSSAIESGAKVAAKAAA